MPRAPNKLCSRCGTIHAGRGCPSSDARYERERGTYMARGYGKARWGRFRRLWLAAHPLCGDRLDGRSAEHSLCAKEGRIVPGTHVDHIRPHRGDSALMYDLSNIQTLCDRDHSRKTAIQDGRWVGG